MAFISQGDWKGYLSSEKSQLCLEASAEKVKKTSQAHMRTHRAPSDIWRAWMSEVGWLAVTTLDLDVQPQKTAKEPWPSSGLWNLVTC